MYGYSKHAFVFVDVMLYAGAEIPFHCRGGQYMVKFQSVIPGGDMKKLLSRELA